MKTKKLKVELNKIAINATTDLGALHGLETLLQLLQNSSTLYYFLLRSFQIPTVYWRGLMIDAARHFQPVDVIKEILMLWHQ
jgi:hexosaminidase